MSIQRVFGVVTFCVSFTAGIAWALGSVADYGDWLTTAFWGLAVVATTLGAGVPAGFSSSVSNPKLQRVRTSSILTFEYAILVRRGYRPPFRT